MFIAERAAQAPADESRSFMIFSLLAVILSLTIVRKGGRGDLRSVDAEIELQPRRLEEHDPLLGECRVPALSALLPTQPRGDHRVNRSCAPPIHCRALAPAGRLEPRTLVTISVQNPLPLVPSGRSVSEVLPSSVGTHSGPHLISLALSPMSTHLGRPWILPPRI